MGTAEQPHAIREELEALLDADDRRQLADAGVSIDDLVSQIELFRTGCPPVRLSRPCRRGDGVRVIDGQAAEGLLEGCARAVAAGRVAHFVPASGAASRMFRSLLAVRERYEHIDDRRLDAMRRGRREDEADFLLFLDGLDRFAFVDDLRAAMAIDGHDLDRVVASGDRRLVLDYLLTARGLGYGVLPKGLIRFHRYGDDGRTSFEEHLVETGHHTADGGGKARIHFTVSPRYRHLVARLLDDAGERLASDGIELDISLSEQHPSTDTIAVDADDRPLRDANGRLVLRPGGHGALLENLNALEGDIVFLKNIDNVAHERCKADGERAWCLLCGYLVDLEERIHTLLRQVRGGQLDDEGLERAFALVREELSVVPPAAITSGSAVERTRYLERILDRPLRVCGMVENRGEPGGAPFWVEETDGSLSVQIVEAAQVDMQSPGQRELFESSTHFNPVFLVCGVRDMDGQPYDLRNFRNPRAGSISTKSMNGAALKALELPGLWNGAMAGWNTVFVEIPIGAFNPVKTVLDLLRERHRPD